MNQLILHPRDINATADMQALLAALQAIGFIGEDFELDGQRHYRPGEDFLELMTFLGCSPVISLGEPGLTGEDFCHISLLPEQPEPQLLHGNNIKPPRCPHCRQPQQAWPLMVQEWQQDRQHHLHTCPHCQQQTPVPQLKWRQSAGFLRSGIVVWGIYEGEAVPSEQLLETLERASGQRWSYFYLNR